MNLTDASCKNFLSLISLQIFRSFEDSKNILGGFDGHSSLIVSLPLTMFKLNGLPQMDWTHWGLSTKGFLFFWYLYAWLFRLISSSLTGSNRCHTRSVDSDPIYELLEFIRLSLSVSSRLGSFPNPSYLTSI